jgi:hypothetical protein
VLVWGLGILLVHGVDHMFLYPCVHEGEGEVGQGRTGRIVFSASCRAACGLWRHACHGASLCMRR